MDGRQKQRERSQFSIRMLAATDTNKMSFLVNSGFFWLLLIEKMNSWEP